MTEEKTNFIYFYGHGPNKPLSYMSQWYRCDFKEGNNLFTSAEHYMMYRKALLFEDDDMADQILRCRNNPRVVKALGRQVRDFDQDTWASQRLNIVTQGNRLKFQQNEDIKLQLMVYPRGVVFVEAAPRDRIWGIGFGARNAPANRHRWGLNLLGLAITAVHEEFLDAE